MINSASGKRKADGLLHVNEERLQTGLEGREGGEESGCRGRRRGGRGGRARRAAVRRAGQDREQRGQARSVRILCRRRRLLLLLLVLVAEHLKQQRDKINDFTLCAPSHANDIIYRLRTRTRTFRTQRSVRESREQVFGDWWGDRLVINVFLVSCFVSSGAFESAPQRAS